MNFKTQPKTILINLLTAFLIALVIEFLWGFGLQNPRTIPRPFLKYYQSFYKSEDRNIIQVTSCAEYNPEFFYRLKPGKCAFTNREFKVQNYINSYGLRDDEESLNNPALVVLGDSFTMGWGVEQEESYPQLLEKSLDKKILNTGISSYGTARELKLIEKLKLEYPHVIIIQYHENDFEENQVYLKSNYKLPVRTLQQYDSLKEKIEDRSHYFLFKYMMGITKAVAKSFNVLKPDEIPNDTIEAETFLKIVQHADINHEAAKIIVFEVGSFNMNNDNFVNAIDYLLTRDQYAKLHISTVKISDALSKDDYFILDEHINIRGHQKVAARLSKYLDEPATSSTPPPILK